MEATKTPAFSLSRRVGSTNYTVRAYCSVTESKNFEEKIFHMIKNEELASDEDRGIMTIPQVSRQSERSA